MPAAVLAAVLVAPLHPATRGGAAPVRRGSVARAATRQGQVSLC